MLAQVIGCLRAIKDQVSENCQKEVFKVQLDVSAGRGAHGDAWRRMEMHGALGIGRMRPGPEPCTLQAAEDFRADPMLYSACKADSELLCAGMKNGGGRIQACLVRGREAVVRLPRSISLRACSWRNIPRMHA